MPETTIASFVLRFTQEEAADPAGSPWRGIIRHVQSNEQARFTRFQDALDFIGRYVEMTNDPVSGLEATTVEALGPGGTIEMDVDGECE